jgi:peptidoglycan/LPS O-acetylase OafA/YrhL
LLIFCCAAFLFCPALRAILTYHGVIFYAVHQNTICRADSLLAGGALALLLRSRIHDRALKSGGWLLAAGAAVLMFLRMTPAPPQGSVAYAIGYGVSYSALSAIFVAMIALAFRGGLITRICQMHMLRWIGKYSYGLYVLHLPIFEYLQQPLRHLLWHPLHENKTAIVVRSAVLSFGISIVAAYASYNLYERRFLRLKRYFDYRPPEKKVPDQGDRDRDIKLARADTAL